MSVWNKGKFQILSICIINVISGPYQFVRCGKWPKLADRHVYRPCIVQTLSSLICALSRIGQVIHPTFERDQHCVMWKLQKVMISAVSHAECYDTVTHVVRKVSLNELWINQSWILGIKLLLGIWFKCYNLRSISISMAVHYLTL